MREKNYRASVIVSLQDGVTDPEGNATSSSLKDLGFPVEYVKTFSGFNIYGIKAGNKKEAESRVDEMCKKLLANPVKDRYQVQVEEMR